MNATNNSKEQSSAHRQFSHGNLVPVSQRIENPRSRSITEVLAAIEDFPQDIQDKIISDFNSGSI